MRGCAGPSTGCLLGRVWAAQVRRCVHRVRSRSTESTALAVSRLYRPPGLIGGVETDRLDGWVSRILRTRRSLTASRPSCLARRFSGAERPGTYPGGDEVGSSTLPRSCAAARPTTRPSRASLLSRRSARNMWRGWRGSRRRSSSRRTVVGCRSSRRSTLRSRPRVPWSNGAFRVATTSR